MAEGEVKKVTGLTDHIKLASLEKLAWKIQFHLPFKKCRQDLGEIKKNIYSSRKLKVAAGGWKAAGRRGKQECLVRSHSKGKSAQSQRCWLFELQLLLSSKSRCQLRGILLGHLELCVSCCKSGRQETSTHLFCCFLPAFHVLADLCTLSMSSLLFQGQAKHLRAVFSPHPLVSERHGLSLPGLLFSCLHPSPLLLLGLDLELGFDVWQQLTEMYLRG